MVRLGLLMGTLLLIHDATVHIQNHLILEILQTYLRNLLVLLLKWQKLTYFSTLKSKGTSFVFVERSITSSSAEPGRKIFAIISLQLGASSHSSASRIPSTYSVIGLLKAVILEQKKCSELTDRREWFGA